MKLMMRVTVMLRLDAVGRRGGRRGALGGRWVGALEKVRTPPLPRGLWGTRGGGPPNPVPPDRIARMMCANPPHPPPLRRVRAQENGGWKMAEWRRWWS